jgi:hypothetical protein
LFSYHKLNILKGGQKGFTEVYEDAVNLELGIENCGADHSDCCAADRRGWQGMENQPKLASFFFLKYGNSKIVI